MFKKSLIEKYEKRIEAIKNYFTKIELEKKIEEYYKNKVILVTGGAGAIGSNLITALSLLVGKNGKVIILDNLSSLKSKDPWNIIPLPNIMFVYGDIRDEILLKRVFNEEPEIVYHMAAFFANQNSIDYPEISAEVDILGLIKMLEYSKLGKIKKFIYTSSGCAIYGSYPKLPVEEDFISMHLTTPYQVNKMTGEMYCNLYYHNFALNTINCRFFNSYGPGEVPGQYRNVIPNFIYWAIKGLPLPITGSGEETRDFTFVFDLVQGLIKAGYYKEAIGEAFNLASSKEIKIVDLALMVNEITNNKSAIEFRKRRHWDTKPRLLASIDRAKKLIDYKPIVDFKDGILMTLEWFKDNLDLIEVSADFPPGMNSAIRG